LGNVFTSGTAESSSERNDDTGVVAHQTLKPGIDIIDK
jgi:hypothetical protein